MVVYSDSSDSSENDESGLAWKFKVSENSELNKHSALSTDLYLHKTCNDTPHVQVSDHSMSSSSELSSSRKYRQAIVLSEESDCSENEIVSGNLMNAGVSDNDDIVSIAAINEKRSESRCEYTDLLSTQVADDPENCLDDGIDIESHQDRVSSDNQKNVESRENRTSSGRQKDMENKSKFRQNSNNGDDLNFPSTSTSNNDETQVIRQQIRDDLKIFSIILNKFDEKLNAQNSDNFGPRSQSNQNNKVN